VVEKTDGAEMTCKSCGTELICHMSNYKGNYKNQLQWQNEDGKAHYSTTNGKDFTCNVPEQEEPIPDNEIELKPKDKSQTVLPENIPHNLTTQDMLERIYAMTAEMYQNFTDRKLKESKTQ